MAEDRTRPTGQHRRHRMLEWCDGWAADGVDAWVGPVEASDLEAPRDRAARQTERHELRPRDLPLLPGGKLGDFYFYVGVIDHARKSVVVAASTPPDLTKFCNMAATTTPTDLTDEQKAIAEMVRQFADEQIIPNAEHYDHEDEFPEPIVEQMKELGLFGVTIPEEFGGMGLDLTTYAMIVEQLSRGWISISGIVNTHFIGSYLLMKFGTDEQKQKYLPRMATGEVRAAFSLSEPELGSDVAAIKTSAKKTNGDYEINGTKMWVTNGLRAGLVFVLVRTDPEANP
jgi:hypothetical protein